MLQMWHILPWRSCQGSMCHIGEKRSCIKIRLQAASMADWGHLHLYTSIQSLAVAHVDRVPRLRTDTAVWCKAIALLQIMHALEGICSETSVRAQRVPSTVGIGR